MAEFFKSMWDLKLQEFKTFYVHWQIFLLIIGILLVIIFWINKILDKY